MQEHSCKFFPVKIILSLISLLLSRFLAWKSVGRCRSRSAESSFEVTWYLGVKLPRIPLVPLPPYVHGRGKGICVNLMFPVNFLTGEFLKGPCQPFPLQDEPLAAFCVTLSSLPVNRVRWDWFSPGPRGFECVMVWLHWVLGMWHSSVCDRCHELSLGPKFFMLLIY